MHYPSTQLNATTAAFSQTTRTNQFTATNDTLGTAAGEKNMSRMTDEPGIFTPNVKESSL